MDGRIYAINRRLGLLAIETELHGFTIIELETEADVEIGDSLRWDSDLGTGSQTYFSVNTKRVINVRVHAHLLSRDAVRQHLQM